MKLGTQFKIVGLTFLCIIILVSILTVVSVKTAASVKAHHAAKNGEHTETTQEHGDTKEEHGDEAKEEHGDDAAAHEHATEAKEEHGDEAKDEHGDEAKDEHATKDAHGDKAKPVETKTAAGDVEAGKKVFMSNTCNVCHKVTVVASTGAIGPSLDGLASRAGKDTKQDPVVYIKESIENPTAYVVKGFPPAMTPGLKNNMSETDYQNLIAFLMSLK